MKNYTPEALIITAGGGMSAESGLSPLWEKENLHSFFQPAKNKNIDFTELGQPKWFLTDPGFAWGFYGKRALVYSDAKPHDGYHNLLNWGKSLPLGCSVITSNVDGLFKKTDDTINLEEVHGSAFYVQCTRNCHKSIWKLNLSEIELLKTGEASKYPRCSKCGHAARPNILMFNDHNWNPERANQQRKKLNNWISSLKGKNVLILEIGAGTRVPTIKLTSLGLQNKLKAKMIIVNPIKEVAPSTESFHIQSNTTDGINELLSIF